MKDTTMIFGGDGYIGWPLALHLAWRSDSEVVIVDSQVTRRLVASVGSDSLVRIGSPSERIAAYQRASGKSNITFVEADARDPATVDAVISRYMPKNVVHLAQQRSAPFSMIDQEHALYTQLNNVATNMNVVFSMVRHVPGAHLLKMGCYDEQTEVLTRGGWRHFWELDYSDEICCLDPKRGEVTYSPPSNIVAYQYKGRMMRILTRSLDFLITPNHRVAYRYTGSEYGPTGEGPIHIGMAGEIFGRNFAVPRSGEWNAPDAESFELPAADIGANCGDRRLAEVQVLRMDRLLPFFGWFVAQGCVRRRQGEPTEVRLSQKKGSPNVMALTEAVQNLGFDFTVSEVVDRRRGATKLDFTIADSHLATFLVQFGDSENRFIPTQLKNVSRRQLRLLFDALMLGDGHVRKKTGSARYYSRSMRLLSDVQEIAMKLGYGAAISLRRRRGKPSEHYVSISRHKSGLAKRGAQSWEPYNGLVYCCTVPMGVIMVRRNGKAGFSGNTMGEYGTPNIEITEGPVTVTRKGRKERLMFPRTGQSWYHLSKVFDTHNVLFANRIHGLTSTDVMQGVVYGSLTDEMVDGSLATRLDFDSIWGTVINKYVVQAVLMDKLLIYGKGKQSRGYLSLYDSIQCLSLLLDSPPDQGEYRVVNQIDETFDTLQLARKVTKIAAEFGIYPEMERVENPRVEKEEHFYGVEHKILPSLGFSRTKEMDEVLREIFRTVISNRARGLKMKSLVAPSVTWAGEKRITSGRFALPRDLTAWSPWQEVIEYARENPSAG